MGEIFFSICLLWAAGLASDASPDNGPVFEIARSAVAGGHGTSTGGAFELSATIGQAEEPKPLVGTNFELITGVWSYRSTGTGLIFQDGFESGDADNWSS